MSWPGLPRPSSKRNAKVLDSCHEIRPHLDPNLHRQAFIRGLRFPVRGCLGCVPPAKRGETILESYPYLETEDIAEALRYAAFLAEDETMELAR